MNVCRLENESDVLIAAYAAFRVDEVVIIHTRDEAPKCKWDTAIARVIITYLFSRHDFP
jgi:hypothetical protein